MAKKPLPAHSLRGPSSGDRWIYRVDPDTGQAKGCPASVRLSEGIKDETSIYAAEGTAAHWVSELCRRKNLPAASFIGYTHKEEMAHPDGGSIICTQEMADAVQVFLDYVNAIPCTAAGYEEKVTYMQWVSDDGFGTADDIRIDENSGTVYVTDLKYGKGVQVFARDNIQLLLYALGVYEVYSPIYDFNKFRLAISQPRLDHVDEWDVSVRDLLAWADNIVKPAAGLTGDKNAPINPGPWCRWCPARYRCRKRILWVLNTADVQSEMLSNRELAIVYDHVDSIRKLCSDVEAIALKEAMRYEGAIPGHKVVEGRSNRYWQNETTVKRRMLKDFKKKDIIEEKLISVAQFEKMAGKGHELLDKKFVNKPDGKPTLVPLSDKRKPMGLDADKEFADFGKEEEPSLDDLLS